MAFNWQTFRTRALTAAVFVVVMLAGLLWNRWSFLVLFSVIHFGCWWEYLKLVERIRQVSIHLYIKEGLMLLGYGLMLWFCGKDYGIAGYGIKENFSLVISTVGFVILLIGIFQKAAIGLKVLVSGLAGVLYISLSFGLLLSLYDHSDLHIYDTMLVFTGGTFPILIIASIWINDTMAYIVGSVIGKTPLSKVSPKKTWEGTTGGVLLSILATGFLFPVVFLGKFDLTLFVTGSLIAAVSSVSGTVGDLLESKLKRMAGVKDSGQIMPGHGGFLDRFDSLLLAAPFVWVFLQLFQ